MTHTLQNSHARTALEGKLVAAFNSAKAPNGLISVWGAEFDPVCRESLKSVSDWMRESDLREFIMREGFAFCTLNSIDFTATGGQVADFLSASQISSLASLVVDGLATIPKTYDVRLPVHHVSIIDDLAITPDIHLISMGGKGPASPARTFLQIKGVGFASYDRTQSAIREACGVAKIVFVVGSIYGVFSKGRSPLPTYNAISNTRNQLVHHARVVERGTDTGETHVVLGVGFSQYLECLNIEFDDEDDQLKRNLSRVSVAIQLMYDPSMQKNVVSIRRALEWSFDAQIDEDPTTSFIKTCIGLEALLAEQEDGIGITAQLADRCAYVLHRTAVDRAETRVLVKEIYQLRSKIVHGNISGISHANVDLVIKATEILSTVLRVEINAVVEWAQKQRRPESKT